MWYNSYWIFNIRKKDEEKERSRKKCSGWKLNSSHRRSWQSYQPVYNKNDIYIHIIHWKKLIVISLAPFQFLLFFFAQKDGRLAGCTAYVDLRMVKMILLIENNRLSKQCRDYAVLFFQFVDSSCFNVNIMFYEMKIE